MTLTVYQAISLVARDIAQEGIGKDRKNVQQGYSFRGIDDVYNALSPILAKHGLVILPRCISRNLTERQTQKGGTMFSVVVECEFDFISSQDGSSHTVKTYGEAMDSGDKATNKAMSAAYKYAAMQAFCIPTEGDNDADAHTPPPIAARVPAKPKPAPRRETVDTDTGEIKTSGPLHDHPLDDVLPTAEQKLEYASALKDNFAACPSVEEVKALFGDLWKELPKGGWQRTVLKAAYDGRMEWFADETNLIKE